VVTPTELKVGADVLGQMALRIAEKFGPFEGISTDGSGDEESAFEKVLPELMARMEIKKAAPDGLDHLDTGRRAEIELAAEQTKANWAGKRLSCVEHGLALMIEQVMEAEADKVNEVSAFRASMSRSTKFGAGGKAEDRDYRETKEAMIAKSLSARPAPSKANPHVLTSDPALVSKRVREQRYFDAQLDAVLEREDALPRPHTVRRTALKETRQILAIATRSTKLQLLILLPRPTSVILTSQVVVRVLDLCAPAET
jgi:hypothetical protein